MTSLTMHSNCIMMHFTAWLQVVLPKSLYSGHKRLKLLCFVYLQGGKSYQELKAELGDASDFIQITVVSL